LLAIFEDAQGKEAIAGLGALAGVGIYYFVIWLLRNRLKNEFVFYIK
jgi:hypothetical protein